MKIQCLVNGCLWLRMKILVTDLTTKGMDELLRESADYIYLGKFTFTNKELDLE